MASILLDLLLHFIKLAFIGFIIYIFYKGAQTNEAERTNTGKN